ncbi:hypothetical protein ACGFXC_15750 [Streptomyces sp. NPDC048507]|uniref:hypothetical protein n=1 Tax=Streptomyces sp. NPDC048507 TaxID=3365560 RepID=UPI0037166CBD
MTDHVPINPCTIPQFTGDLDALQQDHTAITAAAGTFRDAGSNVDSEFQGLSAFYSAPEAAQLFATTKPVKTDSDFFADQLESAAKALGEYITEARPIVAQLKTLQAKATTFNNKISGDEHWKDDGDKIDENNDLIHDVNAAVSAFWAAERTCANKIRALYCGAPLTADDGSHGANMYGYKGEDLNKAQDLPWGSQLEETHRWYEVGHWVKSFVWDGLIVDGIWGTIRGLGTLVGVDGWDKAGQAWTGLAKLATGLAIMSVPGMSTAFWMADDKDLPGWIRDSRTAVKETGKALVAWDEWGKNPARAAGAVTFNVLTTVFTGGAGTAAKAGGVAKVLSVAGKAGRLIDPITYIGKAGSLAKIKIGDLFANLGKADGAFPKLDDVIWKDLPKADAPGVTFPHPEDTVRLPDDALGRPQYFDKTTNQLLDHQGVPKQDLTSVPKGSDHPLAEVPKHEPVPVGVGAHTADVTAHTPGGTAGHTPGGVAEHTPGGVADNTAHNTHTEPGGTDPTHTGGTHHTDTPTTGGGGHDGPTTGGGGHDGPTIPHQGDGPGGGSLPDGPAGAADDGVLPGGSEVRPDGARYIEEPTVDHVRAAEFYDGVRADPESLDISAISDNTGISPQVLDRVRTHFFLSEHVVSEAPGVARNGYFTPRADIAEIWEAAGQRSLSPEEATKFERYIAHEYVESHLMDAGLPYVVDSPHLWGTYENELGITEHYHEFPRDPRDAGAHDLALNENKGNFNHWRAVGFDVPKIELASDLSNIDEMVAALKDELRAKGIELK